MPEDLGCWYKSPASSLKWDACDSLESQKFLTALDQYFLSYLKKN